MSDLLEEIRSAIEKELQDQITRLSLKHTQSFLDMLTYHMGWSGKGAGPAATGKRLRPLLLLLTTCALDEDWRPALPAAAAVELIHNFSLVHDDIQDNSETRRGRLTVWKIWGIPMAINAGDALFVISNQALLDLHRYYPAERVIRAATILHENCLALTTGQFLDLAFQNSKAGSLDDYWNIVNGKTAALLSASTSIGALLSGCGPEGDESLRLFGFHLGRAFQVEDDILGIWGDEIQTGKPTGNDLMEGKNSLPVIFGLTKQNRFAETWAHGIHSQDQAAQAARDLIDEGALDFARRIAEEETDKALRYLLQAEPRGEAGEVLIDMTRRLLDRRA